MKTISQSFFFPALLAAVALAAVLVVPRIKASNLPAARPMGTAEPFIGEIRWVGFNFAPRGWAFCDGQLLNIADNDALFSLLGTTYGGNGRTTFGLPDLRGRIPVHFGQGPGLPDFRLGERGGVEQVALNPGQMPAHTHTLHALADTAAEQVPENHLLAGGKSYAAGPAAAGLDPSTIAPMGAGQPHNNMAPFQTGRAIIALFGVYPSRN